MILATWKIKTQDPAKVIIKFVRPKDANEVSQEEKAEGKETKFSVNK